MIQRLTNPIPQEHTEKFYISSKGRDFQEFIPVCAKLYGDPYFEGPLFLRCGPEMAFCPGDIPWLSLAASQTTASFHQQTTYLFSVGLIFEPHPIKSSCLNLMTFHAR